MCVGGWLKGCVTNANGTKLDIVLDVVNTL
jgi:hypothetical protein